MKRLRADDLLKITGEIVAFHVEQLELPDDITSAAAPFASVPGTVFLASGGNLDCAQNHLLAVFPIFSLKSFGDRFIVETQDDRLEFGQNPLDGLETVLEAYETKDPGYGMPVCSGLFGYLAYDLKNAIERLPKTTLNDLGLPDLCLYFPSALCWARKGEKKAVLCIPVFSRTGKRGAGLVRDRFLEKFHVRKSLGDFSGNTKGFISPFTRDTYMAAVARIRSYIKAGHIYQVNLSQRFETDFSGDPYGLFSFLFKKAPAPFYAYINASDHHVVSTSPERFLLRKGDMVETRPIKGTRPRGVTPEEDTAYARELQASKKDEAELSMIVDLLRNDLGRVCKGGSVKVKEHKRLEAYENVFHLVSVIEGSLAGGKSSIDLIRAAFPGGSITGCPKIRAMEIIDELEPTSRHVYTGAIGYIGFHKTLDLSVAIRTATVKDGRIYFPVGGGVVYDSDPAEEYDETLHKGRSVMRALGGKAGVDPGTRMAWFCGRIIPEDQAVIPVTSPGFRYGFGFFETIFARMGKPRLLELHMKRFTRTWKALFETSPLEIDWDVVISQVLYENGLTSQDAAVRLIAALGDENIPSKKYILAVTARPYKHRTKVTGTDGIDLAVYPHPRQTPLADHKTMNYLFYDRAGAWAKKQGAGEALILNPDRTISETNTANILVVRGDTIICPKSPHSLPGVMQAALVTALEKRGFTVRNESMIIKDLFCSDLVILTNALMGPVAALSVDGAKLPRDMRLWEKIQDSFISDIEQG